MSRGKERTDPYYPLLNVFPHLFLFVFLFLCITHVSSPEGTPDTLCNFYAVIMSLRRSEPLVTGRSPAFFWCYVFFCYCPTGWLKGAGY
ncbi:hypothetical protein F5X96DRAFT_25455 [Biscogniauxia mediterranea]|nr:hypothetical protein F5X96DRAFT_25455 [Biscogniauxia mediterranea]